VKGRVLRGSRNVFTVSPETPGPALECRIKGKILKGGGNFRSPLASGDWVNFEEDPARPGTGLILSVLERRGVFARLNSRGLESKRLPVPQILAANTDLVLCVTTPASPPFRPRFIDRVLLQADAAGIPAAVICNKWDLFDGNPGVEERLEDFRRIGVKVLRLSAKTGEGLDGLRSLIRNRFSLLTGQSGVGKSSLVNALLQAPRIRVGALNEKYGRGNHTTSLSETVEIPEEKAWLVDTPGMRLFIPWGIGPEDLIFHMREFAPLAGNCAFGFSCSHRGEQGCRITEAVEAGVIHEDRYESFLRLREELAGNAYAE
jgi:ribosome biogenesis GTPase